MTLTNAEIVARYKALADFSFKADSGTTTTLTSKKLIDNSDISGFYVCFISGANFGLDKIITSFNDTTGTLTFSALSSSVLNTDEVAIVENGFQAEVKQAELFIINYLRNKGLDFNLMLNKPQLKESHIYKTLDLICSNLMKDAVDADVYYAQSVKYQNLFNLEMDKLVADYDINENGTIEQSEEVLNVGQVRFFA